MKKLSSSGEINTIIGNALVEQVELEKKRVINLKGSYGGKLNTTIDDVIKAFDRSVTYAVFDVSAKQSEDTMTESTEDGLIVYDSYTIQVIFYGPNANIYAMKFYSRIQTEELLVSLREQGLHIQDVEDSGELSDFVNASLLIRRDITLHTSCQLDINKITNYSKLEEVTLKTKQV